MESSIIQYVVLCTTALVVSGLTLFSGFGLGTLLMPVFAIFFPLGTSVATSELGCGSQIYHPWVTDGGYRSSGRDLPNRPTRLGHLCDWSSYF
jgi:hypothetical protein